MTKIEFRNKLDFAEWAQWCGMAFSSPDNGIASMHYLDSESVDYALFIVMVDIFRANNIIDDTRKIALLAQNDAPGASQFVGVGVVT